MRVESNFSEKPSRADENSPRVIPPHGGYRKLRSFQVAEMVYDGTVVFCDRFVFDAIRELMNPPEPLRRRIGFSKDAE